MSGGSGILEGARLFGAARPVSYSREVPTAGGPPIRRRLAVPLVANVRRSCKSCLRSVGWPHQPEPNPPVTSDDQRTKHGLAEEDA